VYPFHYCCLDILTEVLTGSGIANDIDKKVLFEVMDELALADEYCLKLDYGSVSGRDGEDGIWDSIPGEEVCPPSKYLLCRSGG
jgi:hypothetical protein